MVNVSATARRLSPKAACAPPSLVLATTHPLRPKRDLITPSSAPISRRYLGAVSVARPLSCAVLAAALLGAASAAAAPPETKSPWATVNVCDTPSYPNTVGIRASMPASGARGERMFIRFQVQFYRASDNSWHDVGPAADSGFLSVGSSKSKARQAGRNFTLEPPARGASHIVRGVVTFEWRRAGQVVRRAVKRTRAGRKKTIGADPPGFSAATCEIR